MKNKNIYVVLISHESQSNLKSESYFFLSNSMELKGPAWKLHGVPWHGILWSYFTQVAQVAHTCKT